MPLQGGFRLITAGHSQASVSIIGGTMPLDLKAILNDRMGENYSLHERYLNSTLVTVLRTIGFDKVYTSARGAYLYDREGNDYLDFLSGYSVYNIGRNHPTVRQALTDVLSLDLPNMVQMDCSILSGLLAEALLKKAPAHLGAVFFCNSGAEAVEGALKFARNATGRDRFISLEGAFHGLTLGALSVMGCESFREGAGTLLSSDQVPLGDLNSLECLLATRQFAAFILEPVQGKGVHYATPEYYREAQQLCRTYGTLLICDEVQTGLGRTGRWWGHEHWGLEPDIVTTAKALSGGYVPCAAILTRREIFQKTYSRLDRCVIHSSTFGRNNLAMACGLATLEVLEEENLVANAEKMGALLVQQIEALKEKHSIIGEVRGKGLMIAIEFQEPKEFTARMGWRFLQSLGKEVFAQTLVTTLLTRHRILTQVAAHGAAQIKILPPLMIGEKEVERFVAALDASLAEYQSFPGPIWTLGNHFIKAQLQRAGSTL